MWVLVYLFGFIIGAGLLLDWSLKTITTPPIVEQVRKTRDAVFANQTPIDLLQNSLGDFLTPVDEQVIELTPTIQPGDILPAVPTVRMIPERVTGVPLPTQTIESNYVVLTVQVMLTVQPSPTNTELPCSAVTLDRVRVRSGSSLTSLTLDTLSSGQRIVPIEILSEWIRFDGGWVSRQYLQLQGGCS